MLGEQPSATGETASAPGLWLVCAHGAGLAGPEAISREGTWRALAWKTEVMAHSGYGRATSVQGLLSALICPWGGHHGTNVGGGWGEAPRRNPGLPKAWSPVRSRQRLPTVWLGQAWLASPTSKKSERLCR